MNPSAEAFVPLKTRGGAKIPAPAPVAATKLRAAAVPFVPGCKPGPKTAPLPAPNRHHADPTAEPISPLTAKTSPYTPVSATLAAKFPAAPPKSADSPGSAADAKVDSKDVLDPVEELPPAVANDWTGSRLPTLFNCHNTKTMATSEPIPLNTVWDLYADDHSGTNMTPLTANTMASGLGCANSFEPIHVASVDSVEGFWRLWRYVPPPSVCANPFTYSWFRKDVKPEWEHPRNKKGGTFTVVIFDRDKPGLNDKQVLDDVFMCALMGLVGESFAECHTTISGVMLKLRPNKPVTMQFWTSHSDPSKLRAFAVSLRETIGKVMGTKTLQKMEYYSHHQKQATSNSLAARMKPKSKSTPDHTF